jgi:hypothetical protein
LFSQNMFPELCLWSIFYEGYVSGEVLPMIQNIERLTEKATTLDKVTIIWKKIFSNLIFQWRKALLENGIRKNLLLDCMADLENILYMVPSSQHTCFKYFLFRSDVGRWVPHLSRMVSSSTNQSKVNYQY